MVDFATEESYETAAKRLYEHHGVEVNPSTIRRKTMKVASLAVEFIENTSDKELPNRTCEKVVLEMDGLMIPTVKTCGDNPDGRKNRKLSWMELKIGAVEDLDSMTRLYATSFQNSDSLGNQLIKRLDQLNPSETIQIHGVGDGALWITEQGERIAGSCYNHLIDFYHLSEYIHSAFEGDVSSLQKIDRCKKELKNGKISKVIRRLQRQRKKNPKHEGVTNCLRYMKNRPGQFDYLNAIENELPIGSGMIESSNRSVIQKRMKIAGAWWNTTNIIKMANLRVLRANNEWDRFWLMAA